MCVSIRLFNRTLFGLLFTVPILAYIIVLCHRSENLATGLLSGSVFYIHRYYWAAAVLFDKKLVLV